MTSVNPRPTSDATASDALAVRPARQHRTRVIWNRVLDEGLALLEERGYEGFTVSAVCKRAGVAPPQLYARVDSKDALFLAVYEHGIARLRVEQGALEGEQNWEGLEPEQVVERAVRAVAQVFVAGQAFLRAVVLIAGAHPEIDKRARVYNREFAERFTQLVLTRAGHAVTDPDPSLAVNMAFNAIWSSLVLRTAYGPAFATPPTDDATYVGALVVMVRRYLFAA